jgi:hypothetical protein
MRPEEKSKRFPQVRDEKEQISFLAAWWVG